MKINLRNANALQLSIQKAISETELETTVKITRFESPETEFRAAREKFQKAIDKKVELLDVLYLIRVYIGDAGNEAGVPVALAEIAELEKKIGIVQPLASLTDFAPQNDQLLAEFEDMKSEQHGQNQYQRRRDEIQVSIIYESDGYVKMLADLRKKKQVISDDLLRMNVNTEITLPDNALATLRKYDLI